MIILLKKSPAGFLPLPNPLKARMNAGAYWAKTKLPSLKRNKREPGSIRTKVLTSRQLAKVVASLADDIKAQDIVILDMRGLVNFCDYFVISTGASDRHVKSIVEGINDGLGKLGVQAHQAKQFKGFSSFASGSASEGAWALLDMGDVVSHTFEPHTREFYGLEHLWQDAPIVKFKPWTPQSCIAIFAVKCRLF